VTISSRTSSKEERRGERGRCKLGIAGRRLTTDIFSWPSRNLPYLHIVARIILRLPIIPNFPESNDAHELVYIFGCTLMVALMGPYIFLLFSSPMFYPLGGFRVRLLRSFTTVCRDKNLGGRAPAQLSDTQLSLRASSPVLYSYG
jgi:hypothetical protein